MINRFGPPLALMGLIFWFSAQPDLSSGLGGWDLLLRKVAHMTEYGLLWVLWARALGWGASARVGAAVLTIGYAATDELHQTTVDGRHGTPVDVLVDAAGVAIAWALWARWAARRRTAARA